MSSSSGRKEEGADIDATVSLKCLFAIPLHLSLPTSPLYTFPNQSSRLPDEGKDLSPPFQGRQFLAGECEGP